jgi:hypothetical protein
MSAIVETEWTMMLPQVDHVFYGRPVASYSEGDGFVVGGHDRRSWAALNRMLTEEDGRGGGRRRRIPVKLTWFVFHETCGCTPEQHAKHGAPVPDDADEDHLDEYGDCYDHCEDTRHGLPPCDDTYGWMIEYAKADAPGAVPVLEFVW